jgi:hypothetical protein
MNIDASLQSQDPLQLAPQHIIPRAPSINELRKAAIIDFSDGVMDARATLDRLEEFGLFPRDDAEWAGGFGDFVRLLNDIAAPGDRDRAALASANGRSVA